MSEFDLIEVTIRYCKDGKAWLKHVDIDKVGGLLWNDPNTGGSGTSAVPGRQMMLLSKCPPPGQAFRADRMCWWDNEAGEWHCPTGPGQ